MMCVIDVVCYLCLVLHLLEASVEVGVDPPGEGPHTSEHRGATRRALVAYTTQHRQADKQRRQTLFNYIDSE